MLVNNGLMDKEKVFSLRDLKNDQNSKCSAGGSLDYQTNCDGIGAAVGYSDNDSVTNKYKPLTNSEVVNVSDLTIMQDNYKKLLKLYDKERDHNKKLSEDKNKITDECAHLLKDLKIGQFDQLPTAPDQNQ